MASLTNYPSTGVDDASIGTQAWTNPTNIYVADGTNVATCGLVGEGASVYSHYLKATNFGFSIPDGATIDGIILEVNTRKNAGSAGGSLPIVKLVVGGNVVGDNKGSSTQLTTTFAWVSFGGTTDKWGTTPTVANINSTDFGIVVQSYTSGANGGYVYVDAVRVTVYYTEGSSGTTHEGEATLSSLSYLRTKKT